MQAWQQQYSSSMAGFVCCPDHITKTAPLRYSSSGLEH